GPLFMIPGPLAGCRHRRPWFGGPGRLLCVAQPRTNFPALHRERATTDNGPSTRTQNEKGAIPCGTPQGMPHAITHRPGGTLIGGEGVARREEWRVRGLGEPSD